jgi:hypothetical protein
MTTEERQLDQVWIVTVIDTYDGRDVFRGRALGPAARLPGSLSMRSSAE